MLDSKKYYIIIMKGVMIVGYVLLMLFLFIGLPIIFTSIRQVDEYERGILFQFGKFK